MTGVLLLHKAMSAIVVDMTLSLAECCVSDIDCVVGHVGSFEPTVVGHVGSFEPTALRSMQILTA